MVIRMGVFRIAILLTIREAELGIAALKALNEKLEQEKSMTSSLKEQIATAILMMELEIAGVQERPERMQKYLE
ncbi:MAG: hypothetical protein WCJ95_21660 [Mariniphaga sp.]